MDNRRHLKHVESLAGLTFDDFSTEYKMAKGNKLKNQAESGKSTKPSNGGKAKEGNTFGGIKSGISATTSFLAEERIKRLFGFVLSISSLFLLVAISSYLFTAKHDQALIDMDTDTLSASGERFRNTMGRTGAVIGRFFVERWFGIPAIVLPLLGIVLGVKVWLGKALLPIRKSVVWGSLLLVWTSVCLAMLFTHDEITASGQPVLVCENCPGGSFGYLVYSWLHTSIGLLGAILLLLAIALSFVIFNFNPDFSSLFASFKSKSVDDKVDLKEEKQKAKNFMFDEDDEDDDPVDSVLNNLINKEDEEEEEIDIPDIESQIEEELANIDTSSQTEEEEEIELTTESSAPAKSTSEDDGDLEIEISSTDESELSEEELDDKVQQFGEYDPKLDLSRYELPGIDLLNAYGSGTVQIDKAELEENKNKIVETLNNYKIEISRIKATIGPTVTLYEIVPAPGVRISKIKNLEDDIALSLAALGIRIIAPIPGKGTIGIEVPNSNPDIVSMRSLIASDKFQNSDMELPIALGKTISNETFVADLAKMPHLLMAGATGQGKSVGLNAILVSLLYKKHPSQIKFVLVDPKKVELTLFNKIERHFLAKLPDDEEAIITDTHKVVKTLNSLCVEMDERYELLKNAHCRNLKEYNAKFIKRKLNPENGHRYLPYIVLVVDEFADLIMTAGKEVETPIARLAQLARAIGIHLIIATQRPSVNIITGTIKANFPARIAFRVTSKIDSRTILDSGGADQLIGRGDMLLSTGNDLIRLQCGFVDTPEVDDICDFIGSQQAYPSAYILPEVADEGGGDVGNLAAEDRDELFEDAARMIVLHQQGSTSLLQRKLKLGYNRAGRLIDQLEAAGIIGSFEGSKARKVLIPDEMSLEQLLKRD